MDLILKQCNVLFKSEWGQIVEQYNNMRDAVFTAEQQLFLAEGQKFYLEKEVGQLKQYISDHRPTILPPFVEDYAPDPEDSNEIDELAISEANCVLEKPLEFYGGYMMQMIYKKNEVLTNAVVKRLITVISQLQREIKLRDQEREAISNVATLNFDLA